MVQQYRYDAYGNIVSVLDPNFEQPYAFTGREWDAESGLYFYRARYYDPEVGRFVSSDPIGLAGGLNAYGYVLGNPVKLFDPFGLEPDSAEFWQSYLDYNNYRGSDSVWEKIDGNIGARFEGDPKANSCAARVSYGLNYGGEPIPRGAPGAYRNYNGDNFRYILKARELRQYFRQRWGRPDAVLENIDDLNSLRTRLSRGQVAIVVSQGHAAVVREGYDDPFVESYLGDAWILPILEQ